MNKYFPSACLVALSLNISAQTADFTPLNQQIAILATSPSSPWFFDFGTRYWLSGGEFVEDLYGNKPQLNSRLTYNQWTGNSAEGFWQLQHQSGVFLKGYFGGGSLQNGQLIDEDFPPGIDPYSRTISPQNYGAINYFSADFGYNIFNFKSVQLGTFIGYHYWHQQYNALGARQVASNMEVVPNIPPVFGPVPNTINVHNEVLTWNSLRLGMNGLVQLNDRLSISTDAAYIYSNLAANDFHNLRIPIRGVFEDGAGYGLQLDAVANWAVTDALSVGLGGRWWTITTNGLAHFEQAATTGQPQAIQISENNYGMLAQLSYLFTDAPQPISTDVKFLDKDNVPSGPSWTGIYLGANIGYGTNASNAHLTPQSEASNFILENFNTPPAALNVQTAGFLGGADLGYNWMVHPTILLGVEGDIDYAHIGGTNAITPSQLNVTTSVQKNISWLGTIRGRLGKLASPQFLTYLTSGPAFARLQYTVNERQPTTNCPYNFMCLSNSQTQGKTGFVIGGGVEYSMTSHTTLKAEYLYLDLGSMKMNAQGQSTSGPVALQTSTTFNTNILRLGAHYKV